MGWMRTRGALLGPAFLLVLACRGGAPAPGGTPGERPAASSLQALMQERGLTEADVTAALKTYTPSGKHDEFVAFSSGGQSGQVIVIGIPSMRILKYIGVFTPEPWQGYAYGDQTDKVLEGGYRHGRRIAWGDTHHPALSETDGVYDGQFLFVNDKANPRLAVINLADFNTVQIVSSHVLESEHGSTFVTPNTEYVVEGSQFPGPLGGGYADISEYNEKYRGTATFWKFDREKGRIDRDRSFVVELPPYMQDLADAGKGDTYGWVFFTSFNTERATGGNLEGKPPLESGASQNDLDFLHMVNWRRAEEVVAQGKFERIADMRVIRLPTAIEEGILYLVGAPKSPHGVDVTPDGKEIAVNGKLDTHVTVYSWEKIKGHIDNRNFEGTDPYGIPILPFQDSIRGQVEMGLGPLHTQWDDKGHGYTSLFIESKVAKWSRNDLKVIEKIPVHYNIGHLSVAGGDTARPDGKWLMAMNKWAIDRYVDVGPLLPQNFQLIDISGEKMQLVADMPIPLGEPHYIQIIRADKLKPITVYKPAGINPITHEVDPFAVKGGEERIERRADGVHVFGTLVRSHITPDTIRVREGDTVHLHLTNIEQAKDATHGFTIAGWNIHSSLEPGKHVNITFVADRPGVFPFYCTEFCSALHMEMAGYLLVEPKGKR